MTQIALERKQAEPIIAATFPGFTGKRITLTVSESVTLSGLNWCEGSRSMYRACTIDAKPCPSTIDLGFAPPWDNPFEGKTFPLPQGYVIAELHQGSYECLYIHINPADGGNLLPAKVELTPHLRTVLVATKTFKSSYGGKSRYEMAKSDSEWSHSDTFKALAGTTFPTPDEWEAAKAELVTLGLLNKAGAITVQGRNA